MNGAVRTNLTESASRTENASFAHKHTLHDIKYTTTFKHHKFATACTA